MDEYANRLKAKLAPDAVALTLVRAGCFLSAYELIKSEVVDKVHGFFWNEFEDGEQRYDEAVSTGSVEPESTEQVAMLEEVHAHRQEIAHELPKLLVDPDFEIRTESSASGRRMCSSPRYLLGFDRSAYRSVLGQHRGRLRRYQVRVVSVDEVPCVDCWSVMKASEAEATPRCQLCMMFVLEALALMSVVLSQIQYVVLALAGGLCLQRVTS
jgi:hypothetical protein